MRNKILAPSPYQGEGWGEVLQSFLRKCDRRFAAALRYRGLQLIPPGLIRC
ncbi:hypothetical protein [Nostoc sp.]|uniref:hypothetical protein n=1 Tax=Nostoc sp. TaxID=1180 RepID=UPI002FF89636